MPDKPLTIATYAAGASLAAITLVYVFGPTFFLDGEAPTSSRRPGVVGLTNPANDCFINSILQVLAGLPDLRIYLIRELHRRRLDGAVLYRVTTQEAEEAGLNLDKKLKQTALQQGILTKALKEVLDKLNERPLYRKTISAHTFIISLQRALHTTINRQQQDAQEFLQVVTERLCDEYHAGRKARQKSQELQVAGEESEVLDDASNIEKKVQEAVPEAPSLEESTMNGLGTAEQQINGDEEEEGFPFEGVLESQIECLTCHFKPKPTVSTFVTLTLNVPEKSSTSLNNCLDGIFKIEHIEDFKCDNCRLEHALQYKERELANAPSSQAKEQLESDIAKIKQSLRDDPEKPPEGVTLPDIKLAPKREITRHMRMSSFPKILALHLSRSIYSSTYSTKNMAKVAFPESLPIGSILDRRKYRLLGVVTHKGGHNSGHYETFRRQALAEPYSTPHTFGSEGAYSVRGSPRPSAVQSPRVSAAESRPSSQFPAGMSEPSPAPTPLEPSPSTSSFSSKSSLSLSRKGQQTAQPTSAPAGQASTPQQSPSSQARSSFASLAKTASMSDVAARVKRKPKKHDNRWWRISDEKVKEAKTSDVLSMQRDAYLLFYELDRRSRDGA